MSESAISELPRRKPKGKANSRLSDFLGDPLPEEEVAMWAALSPPQRAKAIQRMAALTRWIDAAGGQSVQRAAADAGVSVTRMYEMGKAWREKKSLRSLGAFAGAPKKRKSRFDGILRSAARKVVYADPDNSVRKLALELEATCGLSNDEKPTHNTFRKYIEEEKRLREQKHQAGGDLMFDCSACTLTPTQTDIFTVFAILDRWTQCVLGSALGQSTNSRDGYALAARDALRRLKRGDFQALSWVERTERAEIVIGFDQGHWSDFKKHVRDAEIAAPIELSTMKKRFGRYFRPITGLRVGSVTILPARTDSENMITPNADQVLQLSLEVDEYNAAKMKCLEKKNQTTPPEEMLKILRVIAQP